MTVIELAQLIMRQERVGWSKAIHLASERRDEGEQRRQNENEQRRTRRQGGRDA